MLEENMINAVKNICANIFNKGNDEITNSDILTFIKHDSNCIVTDLKVSAQETRTTKVQYNTNVYWCMMALNIEGLTKLLFAEMQTLLDDPEAKAIDVLEIYLQKKTELKRFIQWKDETTEENVRSYLLSSEEKDGINPLPGSRYE